MSPYISPNHIYFKLPKRGNVILFKVTLRPEQTLFKLNCLIMQNDLMGIITLIFTQQNRKWHIDRFHII